MIFYYQFLQHFYSWFLDSILCDILDRLYRFLFYLQLFFLSYWILLWLCIQFGILKYIYMGYVLWLVGFNGSGPAF